MNYENLENLPLLRSFMAIAEEGTVVAAARSLGLTQSAVSKHLARLRAWIGDPLFVRTAAGMQPTPRALEIQQRLDLILEEIGHLTTPAAADPAGFDGVFAISATDLLFSRLLPELIDRVSEQAPGLRLTALPLAQDYSLHSLETGAVNMLIAVNWHAPDQLRQRRLYSDRLVCVLHRDHPLARAPMTPEAYADAAHILVAPLGMRTGVLDPILAEFGLQRRIVATVPSCNLMTGDLIGATRVATVPSRVAERLTAQGPLTVRDLPVSAPAIDYHALWHPRFDREPRLVWMRDQVLDILGD